MKFLSEFLFLVLCLQSYALSLEDKFQGTLDASAKSAMPYSFVLSGLFLAVLLSSQQYQIASQVCSDLDSFQKGKDIPKSLKDADIPSFLSDLDGTHDFASNEDLADVGTAHVLIMKKDPKYYKQPAYSCVLTTMVNFYNSRLVNTGYEIRALELFFEAFKRTIDINMRSTMENPSDGASLWYSRMAESFAKIIISNPEKVDLLNDMIESHVPTFVVGKGLRRSSIHDIVSESPDFFLRKSSQGSLIGESEFEEISRAIDMFKIFIERSIDIHKSRSFLSVNELAREIGTTNSEFFKYLWGYKAYVRPLTLKGVEGLKNDQNFQKAREILSAKIKFEFFDPVRWGQNQMMKSEKQRKFEFLYTLEQKKQLIALMRVSLSYINIFVEKGLLETPESFQETENWRHAVLISGMNKTPGFVDVVDPMFGKSVPLSISEVFESLCHYYYLDFE